MARSASRTAATSASPGEAPDGRSSHSTAARGPRQGETGVRVRDLDADLRRDLGRQRFEQLTDGGNRSFVTGQQEGGRIAIDDVAAARTRDRRRRAGLNRLRPLGGGPLAVDDDLQIELQSFSVEAARCEGANHGSAPVRQEELVAVPSRDDELAGRGRREQQPNAGRRMLDGQPFQVGAGQRDPQEARAPGLDTTHHRATKTRWFTTCARYRTRLSRQW